jgi:hypothetical protein
LLILQYAKKKDMYILYCCKQKFNVERVGKGHFNIERKLVVGGKYDAQPNPDLFDCKLADRYQYSSVI